MSLSAEPNADKRVALWTQVTVAGVQVSAPSLAHRVAGRD